MHVQEQEIQANKSKLAEIEIKLQGMNKIVENFEIYGAEMNIYIYINDVYFDILHQPT